MRRLISVLILAFVSTLVLAGDAPSAEADATGYVPSWKTKPVKLSLDGSVLFISAQEGEPWSYGFGLGPGFNFAGGTKLSGQLVFVRTDSDPGGSITVPVPYEDDYSFYHSTHPRFLTVPLRGQGSDNRIAFLFTWSSPITR